MSWARGAQDDLGREIGYAIKATCDFEGCEAEIDRGLDYCCGTMHGGENGCGRYFCPEHNGTHECPERDAYYKLLDAEEQELSNAEPTVIYSAFRDEDPDSAAGFALRIPAESKGVLLEMIPKLDARGDGETSFKFCWRQLPQDGPVPVWSSFMIPPFPTSRESFIHYLTCLEAGNIYQIALFNENMNWKLDILTVKVYG